MYFTDKCFWGLSPIPPTPFEVEFRFADLSDFTRNLVNIRF